VAAGQQSNQEPIAQGLAANEKLVHRGAQPKPL
jgi:hypothetical protein